MSTNRVRILVGARVVIPHRDAPFPDTHVTCMGIGHTEVPLTTWQSERPCGGTAQAKCTRSFHPKPLERTSQMFRDARLVTPSWADAQLGQTAGTKGLGGDGV